MSTENLNLSGKTALVTGGSRGIGAACAKLLAARREAVPDTPDYAVGRPVGLGWYARTTDRFELPRESYEQWRRGWEEA